MYCSIQTTITSVTLLWLYTASVTKILWSYLPILDPWPRLPCSRAICLGYRMVLAFVSFLHGISSYIFMPCHVTFGYTTTCFPDWIFTWGVLMRVKVRRCLWVSHTFISHVSQSLYNWSMCEFHMMTPRLDKHLYLNHSLFKWIFPVYLGIIRDFHRVIIGLNDLSEYVTVSLQCHSIGIKQLSKYQSPS